MHDLPIHLVLDELNQALLKSRYVLLTAPPGSGKTTIVPLEIAKQPWLLGKKILMLEPRRLATRAAAARMANLLGEPVGETVGYQIRFDRKISDQTQIEVVTEGVLTRRLQSDPELAEVGLIIFDEFHERTLHADVALALALDVSRSLREDLRILVMSATLDTDSLQSLLGDIPVVQAQGQSFPVTLNYLERMSDLPIPQLMVSGVQSALQASQGDLLAFFPGIGEIKRAESLLNDVLPPNIDVHTLHGDLTQNNQDLALKPSVEGRRRVVLATSIAETSLTIEGIEVVVDSGWSRVPRFDPNNGLSRLETIRVSLASADQRAGRAGRLGPGGCFRLWSEEIQQRLVGHQLPEIENADLAPLVLELAQWGVQEPAQLDWITAPPKGLYAQAKKLLNQLQAITSDGRITHHGEAMARVAIHPRLAHMLLSASDKDSRALALKLSALLSEKDLLKRTPHIIKPVDVEIRLNLYEQWKNSHSRAQLSVEVDKGVCHRISQSISQIAKRLPKIINTVDGPVGVGALLATAYPDRIAKRRPGSTRENRFLLSSGKGVVLPEGDPLGNEAFLVIPALDAGKRDGRVYTAASIDLDSIRLTQSGSICKQSSVVWDDDTEAVVARSEERLGALILSHRPLIDIDPGEFSTALFTGIRKRGIAVFSFSKSLHQWLLRLELLGRWQPNKNWPEVTEQALIDTMESWLAPWVVGISNLTQLKKLDWDTILKSRLDWTQQQEMDRLVPTHIQVPSGSKKQLIFSLDGVPVLPVKLQEMFGLMDTPSICNGEVKLLLHLLSPAQRPIQITQDLRGFWENTYSEVKKELKGRYPKHYWPDDPMNAKPTARVRPKA